MRSVSSSKVQLQLMQLSTRTQVVLCKLQAVNPSFFRVGACILCVCGGRGGGCLACKLRRREFDLCFLRCDALPAPANPPRLAGTSRGDVEEGSMLSWHHHLQVWIRPAELAQQRAALRQGHTVVGRQRRGGVGSGGSPPQAQRHPGPLFCSQPLLLSTLPSSSIVVILSVSRLKGLGFRLLQG